MNTLLLPLSNFNGSELDNHLEYIRKTRNNSKHYMTRFRGEINSEMQKSWYSNISKKINPYIFIVEEHGVVFYPVGYGTINIEGDSAMVTGVISQSERGKGFGRKLFSALIEESKKMAQKVSLEVLENNTIGISLYESIGFIETNRDHDVITMELKK
jgi:ribosomal protein S18 acetylase RimI-like enzyme